MSARSFVRAAAVAAVLMAVTTTASGCGQSGPAAAPSTTATSSAAVPTTPGTTSTAADPAGVDAPPAEATVDPGEGSVDGPDVARSVSTELARIVGRAPDSVTCPDLLGRIGAAIRCTLVDGRDSYGVAVTVTSVEGADVKFDIKVDDQAA